MMATSPYPTNPDAPARRDHYHRVQIALHWLIAGLLAFELALGWRAGDLPRALRGALFALHKPIGLTILALMLFRLFWRLTHRPPPLPDTLKPWERMLASATHHLFYLILILIPLGGWAIVSSGDQPRPVDMFGLFSVPALPCLAGNRALNDLAANAHGLLATIAAIFVGLHVAGALKHQFVDRDNDFGRIAPLAHRTLPLAIIGALAAIAAIFLWGRTMPLTPLPTPAPQQAAISQPPPR